MHDIICPVCGERTLARSVGFDLSDRILPLLPPLPAEVPGLRFLFAADEEESTIAALTVSLFAMAGKLIVLLIRQRFQLPDADALLWLLAGAVGGSLLAMLPALQGRQAGVGNALLRLSLFTSLLNIAAALT